MRRRWTNRAVLASLALSGPVWAVQPSTRPANTAVHRLMLTEQDYLDRAKAIWVGQMIGQWTGVQFEHKQASAFVQTPFRPLPGYAPIDDDYYYEMVALRAFEKHGVNLTEEQLGQQWLANNAGSWGSSAQALQLLKRGIKPPDTGSPRYNRFWWTIGPQFSSDIYGMLAPGMPNQAAALARRLTHINGYAEGNDGAVFVAGMISLGFVEHDSREIVKKAARLISSRSPYRQCLEMVIAKAEAGATSREVFDAVNERWGIEYPATNNAVVNGAIVAAGVWFGGGDFEKTEDLIFSAADFADTDCNAANAASVVAAMHGMKAFPSELVSTMNDTVKGATMGDLRLTPPVDESVTELARHSVAVGEKILLAHGAEKHGDTFAIPIEKTEPLSPEIFRLADFMKWWNPEWTLERAGYGGASGGLPGIRGNTYLDGDTLAIWPRDEVRGALLRRQLRLGPRPVLSFDAGALEGSAWRLNVFVNNRLLLDRLIDGGPTVNEDQTARQHWEHIQLDLSDFKNQDVVLRLYDLVLLPHRYAGNSYWRNLDVR